MIRALRLQYKRWFFPAAAIALLFVLPLVAVVYTAFTGQSKAWGHIQDTLLTHYAGATLTLVAGVMFLTLLFGILSAFVVVFVDIPFKRFFEWALMLPLSIPAYLMAFSYAEITGYQGWTSRFFGVQFNLMNMWGAMLLFSLALYPYIYLPLKTFLRKAGFSLLETGASVGQRPVSVLFRIILPLTRPVLFASSFLAVTEVLNDFGVVKYFGVPTFTVGIFRAWTGFADLTAALRLAALLLLFVFGTFWLEKWLGRKKRFTINSHKAAEKEFRHPALKVVGFFWCLLLLLLAFGFPFFQMLSGVWATAHRVINAEFMLAFWHSMQLAFVTAALVVCLALFIEFTVRLRKQAKLAKWPSRVASMGYFIPGGVIALGILAPITAWDKFIFRLSGEITLTISTTLVALIYALVLRYMAVGMQSLQTGYSAISPNLMEASLSLGVKPWKTLFSIDIRALKNYVMVGFILVFVDVLKELPLTMILRPFNYDTLATKAFNFASDELLREASNASILIVVAGLIPILFLNRFFKDASA